MRALIGRSAVEFRPEYNRNALEDLVGAAPLAVFTLEVECLPAPRQVSLDTTAIVLVKPTRTKGLRYARVTAK